MPGHERGVTRHPVIGGQPDDLAADPASFKLVDNTYTVLDVADLVFTGGTVLIPDAAAPTACDVAVTSVSALSTACSRG